MTGAVGEAARQALFAGVSARRERVHSAYRRNARTALDTRDAGKDTAEVVSGLQRNDGGWKR